LRIAKTCTVRDWNPGGGEFFRACPDWHRGPTSLPYNGYQHFLGRRSGWSVLLTTRVCECIAALPKPPVCANLSISWGDLYLLI